MGITPWYILPEKDFDTSFFTTSLDCILLEKMNLVFATTCEFPFLISFQLDVGELGYLKNVNYLDQIIKV